MAVRVWIVCGDTLEVEHGGENCHGPRTHIESTRRVSRKHASAGRASMKDARCGRAMSAPRRQGLGAMAGERDDGCHRTALMTRFRRYAIYWAPPAGSDLARFGASWLGWDADLGEA